MEVLVIRSQVGSVESICCQIQPKNITISNKIERCMFLSNYAVMF